MNRPEDPTSIPSQGGGRPAPPVDDAWAQMKRKLDVNMPSSSASSSASADSGAAGASGSGSAGTVGGAPGAADPTGGPIVMKPWYSPFGGWVAAGVAAVVVVAGLLLFIGHGHTKIENVSTGRAGVGKSTDGGSSVGRGASADGGSSSDGGPSSDGASSSDGGTSSVARVTDSSRSAGDAGSAVGGSSATAGSSSDANTGNSSVHRAENSPVHVDAHSSARRAGASSTGIARSGSFSGTNNRRTAQNSHSRHRRPSGGASAERPGGVAEEQRAETANRENVAGSAVANHQLTRQTKAVTTQRLLTPLRAPDSLLRVAAAKRPKNTIAIGNPRSPAFRKFSAGFTLRQYLPVPGQDFNDYNTDGERYVYSDYVPAIFVRAAITDRSYLQAEFGYHSPQYTRNIEALETNNGASTVPGYAAYLEYEKSTVKKLFYNEFDLTYHYRFGERWWLGAGVQYAILTGGAIADQIILKPSNAALPDVNYSTTVYSMRGHTAFYDAAREKGEWRGVLDVEYAWDRWMLGIRYQQSFDIFYFYITGSPGYTTNSGISIRASYTLWRTRK